MSSNSVGWSAMFPAASRTCSAAAMRSPSEMSAPLTEIRSFTRTRWGEIYMPVLYPAAVRTDASMAQVEPFPLVPATWMNRRRSWGFPSSPISSRIRSRPSRLPFQSVW